MKQILQIIALSLLPFGAFAQADGIEAAQFLGGWRAGQAVHVAALELRLAPEWKTYWRAPGSGGIPPEFDWTGSQNVASVQFSWPKPQIFDVGGITSIGYHDSLVLPFEVTPQDPNLPIILQAKINLGICKDICVPVDLNLQLALPNTDTPDPFILAAQAQVPRTRDDQPRCTAIPIADGMRVTAIFDLPVSGADEVVVLEHADPKMWMSDAQITRAGSQLTAVVDMVPPSAKPFELRGHDMTLTVLSPDQAAVFQGCAIADAP